MNVQVIIDSTRALSRYESDSLWAQGILIVIAILGVGFTIRQLKIASTAAFLQSEVSLFESLRRIDDASAEMVELNGRNKTAGITEEEFKAAQMRLDGAIQNYLNSLDRLCSSILHSVIPRKQARLEYELVLNAAVTNYQNNIPDFDRHYPNIIGLRRKWRL